jgi:tRNA dimethylallyltransferase
VLRADADLVTRRVLAVLGPTATGKSALGLRLAERFDGEIVSCDSTAVYRGLDIGTDKVPLGERRGVPHHLVDIVEPTDAYTAARYATDAAAAIRSVVDRGRLPIVVGGTGLYYRALTRGLFPGPGRNEVLRARLEAVAARRGIVFLHRMVARVDAESARRIQPRDRKRLIRALEVFFLTGRPLTAHFGQTVSPLSGFEFIPVGLRLTPSQTAERVAARVDQQFARGIVGEVEGLITRGVPPTAPAFSGLVYRQVIEMLRGVRDEAATRALIVQENRRYARRQLIWFRKEPNLVWFDGAGDEGSVAAAVEHSVTRRLTGGAAIR